MFKPSLVLCHFGHSSISKTLPPLAIDDIHFAPPGGMINCAKLTNSWRKIPEMPAANKIVEDLAIRKKKKKKNTESHSDPQEKPFSPSHGFSWEKDTRFAMSRMSSRPAVTFRRFEETSSSLRAWDGNCHPWPVAHGEIADKSDNYQGLKHLETRQETGQEWDHPGTPDGIGFLRSKASGLLLPHLEFIETKKCQDTSDGGQKSMGPRHLYLFADTIYPTMDPLLVRNHDGHHTAHRHKRIQLRQF